MGASNADIITQVATLQATYVEGHKAVLEDLAEIKAGVKLTNGRVNELEKCQVLLSAMPHDIKEIRDDVDGIKKEWSEIRGAMKLVKWALAGGLASAAMFVTQLLGLVK